MRSMAQRKMPNARCRGALRWDGADLDPELPPHVAFAGNDHLILAVGSRARLADLDYDFDALAALMRAHGWTTAHLVWREDERRYHARDPFPVGGVVEDPATGAAAVVFGGYLRTAGPASSPCARTRMAHASTSPATPYRSPDEEARRGVPTD
ncbi:hypothetical protein BZZ08_00435 [Streptomyces sp. MH60]|nr:hypothetical protein BZZ08_00435 [Streptomyces sp. MH60]